MAHCDIARRPGSALLEQVALLIVVVWRNVELPHAVIVPFPGGPPVIRYLGGLGIGGVVRQTATEEDSQAASVRRPVIEAELLDVLGVEIGGSCVVTARVHRQFLG